jgi:phosphatidylinositol alpha 1,6-mannosyltransferase
VDRGGPQDLIRHGHNGFVARANDPASLAAHLEPLLRDPGLRRRMAGAARASATSRDWEEINDRLLRSYAEVVRSARVRNAANAGG